MIESGCWHRMSSRRAGALPLAAALVASLLVPVAFEIGTPGVAEAEVIAEEGSWPAVDGSGEYVAFSEHYGGWWSQSGYHLNIADRDGNDDGVLGDTSVTTLVDGTDNPTQYTTFGDADISADGEVIVFAGGQYESFYNLYSIKRNGSGLTDLGHVLASAEPSLSYDGALSHVLRLGVEWRQLALRRLRPGNGRLRQPATRRRFRASEPALSFLGHWVAYTSSQDDNVYIRDLLTGEVTLASVTESGGPPASGRSRNPAVSLLGRWVAFSSDSPGLVDPGLDYPGQSVFVRGSRHRCRWHLRRAGDTATEIISLGDVGYVDDVDISDDGSVVAFEHSPRGGNGRTVSVYHRLFDIGFHTSGSSPSLNNDGWEAVHDNGSSGSSGQVRARSIDWGALADTVDASEQRGWYQGPWYVSDPVNTAIGSFIDASVDLPSPPGVYGLDWARTYNSIDVADGPLGVGWTHSFAVRIGTDVDGTVIFVDTDGRVARFEPDGEGGYIRPDDIRAEVVKVRAVTAAWRSSTPRERSGSSTSRAAWRPRPTGTARRSPSPMTAQAGWWRRSARSARRSPSPTTPTTESPKSTPRTAGPPFTRTRPTAWGRWRRRPCPAAERRPTRPTATAASLARSTRSV